MSNYNQLNKSNKHFNRDSSKINNSNLNQSKVYDTLSGSNVGRVLFAGKTEEISSTKKKKKQKAKNSSEL